LTRALFVPVLGALLVLMIGAGCAAGQLNDEGLKLEAAGDPLGAADKYLAALGHDAKHKDARAGLARVLEDAYEQQLSVARKHEADEDFPEAATTGW
jgi:hypothetical protein